MIVSMLKPGEAAGRAYGREGAALPRHSNRARTLAAVLALIWLLAAIRPNYRHDWLLENLLVFVAIPLIARFGPGLRFSDASYTCLFVFFALHLLGAHYTYAEVPYPQWYQAISGHSFTADFGAGRNHFDRLVHFLYGLLMARPAMELLGARAPPQGIWRWLLPVLFLISHSVIYELVEWAAALLFGGDLGAAYLGTQGDVWDAQKDMALAALGAALGVSFWLHPPAATTRPG